MTLLGKKTSTASPQQPLNRGLFRVVYAWFLSIGVVLFEPAPFDILFAPLAVFCLLRRKLKQPKNISVIFFLTFSLLLTSLISMLEASDLERAIFFVIITCYMFAFAYFVAVLVYNHGNDMVRNIMSAYVLVAIISSIFGILGILKLLPHGILDVVTIYGETRARAFFKDTNVYSPFINLAFIYMLDRLMQNKTNRFRLSVILLTLLLGILASFSRAAFISVAFSVIAYFMFVAIAEKRFARAIGLLFNIVIILLLFGGIVFFFLQQSNLGDFLSQRASFQNYDTGRFELQKMEIEAGLNNILGVGPGQTEVIFAQKVIGSGSSHSLYVRTIGEQGIIGFLFLGLVLFLTGVKAIVLCLKGNKASLGMHCVFASSYFAILICSVVIDTLHWRHFFLIIGVIWGLAARMQNEITFDRNPKIKPSCLLCQRQDPEC